jgi:hypothetical protein
MISDEEFAMKEEPEPRLLDLMTISETTYVGPYRYYYSPASTNPVM